MARYVEAGQHLLAGLTPEQIAGRMGISLSSVRQYLYTLVGEGVLLRSDIAFNIAERRQIEDVIRSVGTARSDVYSALYKHKISRELIDLYLIVRDPRPDLYALICAIEILLHRLIKQTLKTAYEDRWWRKGIPESARKQCQIRREEDEAPIDDQYSYTTFIELKSTIESNWRLFSVALPKAFAADKPDTLQKLQRVNGIRNKVMHPVKEMNKYEDDYRFARKILADFAQSHWRIDEVRVQRPQPRPV